MHASFYRRAYLEEMVSRKNQNDASILSFPLIAQYARNPLQDQLVFFAISQREFWRHKMEVGLLHDPLTLFVKRFMFHTYGERAMRAWMEPKPKPKKQSTVELSLI